MERLETKKDLLTKLRAYSDTPDDETILYKKKIEELLKTVEKAFLSLYDSLFENETLDLMTDISVLEKVIYQNIH